MTTVSLSLSVAPTGDVDDKGRKTCIVKEEILGTDEDPRIWGPMPCVVVEAFCRARRSQFMKAMHETGTGVYIIPH
jgi:hypothetical protein